MSPDSERTCVGCRQRTPKLELLRVVAKDLGSGLTVVPDPAGRMPGRGAHLHPTPECLALALRRLAFPRALRVTDRLASDVVEDYVQRLAETGAGCRDRQQQRPN
jgi:predicted RNA-binding protein YlxR (DUF448 family)